MLRLQSAVDATDDTRHGTASAISNIAAAVAEVNRAATQAPAWPRLVYRHGQLQLIPTGRATAVQRTRGSGT